MVIAIAIVIVVVPFVSVNCLIVRAGVATGNNCIAPMLHSPLPTIDTGSKLCNCVYSFYVHFFLKPYMEVLVTLAHCYVISIYQLAVSLSPPPISKKGGVKNSLLIGIGTF